MPASRLNMLSVDRRVREASTASRGADQHGRHLGRHKPMNQVTPMARRLAVNRPPSMPSMVLPGLTAGASLFCRTPCRKIRARICRPDQSHHEQQYPGPHHGVVVEVVATDGHQGPEEGHQGHQAEQGLEPDGLHATTWRSAGKRNTSSSPSSHQLTAVQSTPITSGCS